MDEGTEMKMEDLEKYIPFIDYLLKINNGKQQKLAKIKQWILDKKWYPSDAVQSMQKTIITQYQNQNIKMPREIQRIFGKTEAVSSVKCTTINSCSVPENIKSKKQNTEILSNIIIKEGAPCTSSAIVRDNESTKKQKEVEKSVQNHKDDDDESDDDVIFIFSTKDLENTKSKKQNTEISSNIKIKEEEPCTSSAIVRDSESTKKQKEVEKSVQNHKDYDDESDDDVIFISSTKDLDNIKSKKQNTEISSNIKIKEEEPCTSSSSKKQKEQKEIKKLAQNHKDYASIVRVTSSTDGLGNTQEDIHLNIFDNEIVDNESEYVIQQDLDHQNSPENDDGNIVPKIKTNKRVKNKAVEKNLKKEPKKSSQDKTKTIVINKSPHKKNKSSSTSKAVANDDYDNHNAMAILKFQSQVPPLHYFPVPRDPHIRRDQKYSSINSSIRKMARNPTRYTPTIQLQRLPHTKPAVRKAEAYGKYRCRKAEIEKKAERVLKIVAELKKRAELKKLAERKKESDRKKGAERKSLAEQRKEAKEERAAVRLAEEKRLADLQPHTGTVPDKDNSAPSNLLEKRSNREIKSLDCTFIRFVDEFRSIKGKRSASEQARNEIKKMSELLSQYDSDNKRNVRKPLRKQRRSSFTTVNNEPSCTAAPITKRRKTCGVEFHKASFRASPILNSRKTYEPSLGVARSIFPRVDDSFEPTLEYRPQNIQANIDNNEDITSLDTDIFDLTEFNREQERKDKEEKKKEEQKNTSEETKNASNSATLEANNDLPVPNKEIFSVQLIHAECEKVIQLKSSKKEFTKTTTNQKMKNTNSAMTELNTKSCVLCERKPYSLVNHYVRTHKCEPYVARLSDDKLNDLPRATPCTSNAEGTHVSKYKVTCPFCEDELIGSFSYFRNHFSTHTGEYGFQCENCKLQKPFCADIQSHKYNSKSCRNARIQTLYQYPPNLMTIYLHCCKLCNFVQLNVANVLKHLSEHHDQPTSDTSNLVQKHIAAVINGTEIVNEASQESELLEDEEIEGIPAYMQNMSELKQEFILDELPNLNASEEDAPLNLIRYDIKYEMPANEATDSNVMLNSFSCPTDVKTEINDGYNTDSSVEIIEDIVAEKLDTYRNESNVTAAPKIKLQSFSKFFNNGLTASPSNLSKFLSNNGSPASPPVQSNVAVESSRIPIQNFSGFPSKIDWFALPTMQQSNVSEFLPDNGSLNPPSMQHSPKLFEFAASPELMPQNGPPASTLNDQRNRHVPTPQNTSPISTRVTNRNSLPWKPYAYARRYRRKHKDKFKNI